MDAKSFLKTIENIDIRSNIYFNTIENPTSVNELKIFYSQPFEMEMIVEYFEGWKKANPSEVDYVNTVGNFDFTIIDFRSTSNGGLVYKKETKNKEMSWRTEFITPRTLDEFISDCDRAGISLIFKK